MKTAQVCPSCQSRKQVLLTASEFDETCRNSGCVMQGYRVNTKGLVECWQEYGPRLPFRG